MIEMYVLNENGKTPLPITELTPILSQIFMGMTIKSELLDNSKELSGEKFLIHNKIGFWYKTTKRLIPKVEFFDQNDLNSLRELIELANIPAFITNFSGRIFKIPETRIEIPLSDPEVNVTFYCVCQKNTKMILPHFFHKSKEFMADCIGFATCC